MVYILSALDGIVKLINVTLYVYFYTFKIGAIYFMLIYYIDFWNIFISSLLLLFFNSDISYQRLSGAT